MSLQAAVMKYMLSLPASVTLVSHLSSNPYTVKDFYDDLYAGVWEPTIQGRKLTAGDKLMQKMLVASAAAVVGKSGGGSPGGLVISMLTSMSVDEMIASGMDQTGVLRQYRNQFKAFEAEYGEGIISGMVANSLVNASRDPYGWQGELKVDNIEENRGYNLVMLKKVQSLLKSRVNNANSADKAHYEDMLLQVARALSAN